jgi:hypothetical protein
VNFAYPAYPGMFFKMNSEKFNLLIYSMLYEDQIKTGFKKQKQLIKIISKMETKKEKTKKVKPAYGVYEWATSKENFISGCIHDCRYCFAKGNVSDLSVKQQTTGTLKR